MSFYDVGYLYNSVKNENKRYVFPKENTADCSWMNDYFMISFGGTPPYDEVSLQRWLKMKQEYDFGRMYVDELIYSSNFLEHILNGGYINEDDGMIKHIFYSFNSAYKLILNFNKRFFGDLFYSELYVLHNRDKNKLLVVEEAIRNEDLEKFALPLFFYVNYGPYIDELSKHREFFKNFEKNYKKFQDEMNNEVAPPMLVSVSCLFLSSFLDETILMGGFIPALYVSYKLIKSYFVYKKPYNRYKNFYQKLYREGLNLHANKMLDAWLDD